MVEVRWTPQAADDLEAVCLFIARDSTAFAATFADRVLRATEKLTRFPQLGRMVPELADENIRELLVGNYRIIYRLRKDAVHILTVHHGARLLDSQKFD